MRNGWIGALLWLMATIAWADDKADFLAAREALHQGKMEEVAKRADALSNSPLGIYPRYWLLSAQIDQATPDRIKPFLDFYQGSWLAEKLRGEWLRALAKRGDWALFRDQYAQLQDTPGIELDCDQFQARLNAHDNDALAQARQQIWFTAKDLPAACGPVLQQLLASGTVTTDDIWARLRLAFEANAQGLVRSLADRLGQTVAPKDLANLATNPAAWLQKPTNTGRLQQELAIFAIARLARSDVDAAYAQWQSWQGRIDESLRPYGWRRLGMVAALRLDKRAGEWLDKSAGLGWTDAAVETRLRMALRFQDWDATLTALKLLSSDKQKDRVWQYWQARALEAKGATSQSTQLYAQLSSDDDYYGLLARDRMGPVMSAPLVDYQISADDRQRVKAQVGLQRALLLNDLDMRPESVREWNWALRGADDRLLLAAAAAANDAGWYDRAIYAAERTKTLHNHELRYLAPYRDVTRGYAQELGIDEAWVFGLIRQESRFVVAARSSAGARGLMQLMPATARWVARKLGIKYQADMVNDAGTNVRLGVYYLRHVLDLLNNQPVLATAAYNAGPNRARDWQDPDKSLEAALYVESIPFSETRDYVKKVMTNAVHYSMAFGQARQSLAARMGVIPPRGSQTISGP